MVAKAIIINGDDSWAFRALMWAQALDLFPSSSGVEFRDCSRPAALSIDHRLVLGNFPEDFGSDPYALIDALREDLRNLIQTPDETLSIAFVLRREDLVGLGVKATPFAGQSDAAQAAIAALRSVLSLLERQADSPEERAAATTRLWLSLVIRDAGSDRADLKLAEDAIAALSGSQARVNNVFFLGNGREMQGAQDDVPVQFAKLRVLIDVLRAPQAWTHLRRRDVAGRGKVLTGLRLLGTRATLGLPSTSAELRVHLVELIDKLINEVRTPADAVALEDFDRLCQDFEELVPGLKGESFGRKQAGEVIERALGHQDHTLTLKRSKLGGDASLKDIEEAIAAFRPNWGAGWRIRMRNEKRREGWRRLESEFDSAIKANAGTIEAVVQDALLDLREEERKRRENLTYTLQNLRLPIGTEGKVRVTALGELLAALEEATSAEIAAAQRQQIALSARLDAERHERGPTFALLDEAEGQLLSWLAWRSPILAALVILLPIMIHFGTRWASGHSTISNWGDLWRMMGPIGTLGLAAFVIACCSGLVLGFILSRKLRHVQSHVHARLEAENRTLKDLYAARFSYIGNSERRVAIGQVKRALAPQIAGDLHTTVVTLVDILRRHSDLGNRPQLAKRPTFVAEAGEAFAAHKNWQDRVAAFLATPNQGLVGEIRLQIFDDAEPVTMVGTGLLGSIDVELRAPGNAP